MKRFLAPALLVLLAACQNNQPPEDITDAVDRNGSVESQIYVDELGDSLRVLVTSHKVWVGGNEVKTIEHRDTVPYLPPTQEVAENDNGDEALVQTPGKYKVYITVK